MATHMSERKKPHVDFSNADRSICSVTQWARHELNGCSDNVMENSALPQLESTPTRAMRRQLSMTTASTVGFVATLFRFEFR